MNTNIDETETMTIMQNFDLMWGYKSIDVPILNDAQRFEFSMLRLGRILTAKEEERMDFTAAKISKLMDKHQKMLTPYSAKEIKERLWNLCGEFRGGGIKVEWFDTGRPHRRNDPPHFSISFSRLYIPRDPYCDSLFLEKGPVTL